MLKEVLSQTCLIVTVLTVKVLGQPEQQLLLYILGQGMC